MILKIVYFDNKILFDNERINVIEIENKKTFYRFVKDLNDMPLENGNDIIAFDNNENEIKFENSIVVSDYVNFNFDSKKLQNDISKHIANSVSDEVKDSTLKDYNKFRNKVFKSLNDIDLPIIFDDGTVYEDLIKQLHIKLNYSDDLLERLFLLIDINSQLKLNSILVFINLKQYLNSTEIEELYKYSIFNNVNILLVDSQSYGNILKYEKKLIIDDNFDEFVL